MRKNREFVEDKLRAKIKSNAVQNSLEITELQQHQESLARAYQLLNYQIDVLAEKGR